MADPRTRGQAWSTVDGSARVWTEPDESDRRHDPRCFLTAFPPARLSGYLGAAEPAGRDPSCRATHRAAPRWPRAGLMSVLARACLATRRLGLRSPASPPWSHLSPPPRRDMLPPHEPTWEPPVAGPPADGPRVSGSPATQSCRSRASSCPTEGALPGPSWPPHVALSRGPRVPTHVAPRSHITWPHVPTHIPSCVPCGPTWPPRGLLWSRQETRGRGVSGSPHRVRSRDFVSLRCHQ